MKKTLSKGKMLLLLLTLSSPALLFGQEVASLTKLSTATQYQTTVTLESVLNEAQQKYGVFVNYKSDLVRNKVVDATSVNRKFSSIDELLNELLAPYNLKYERVEDKFYVVYDADNPLEVIPLPRAKPNASQEKSYQLSVPGPVVNLAPAAEVIDKTITGQVTDLSTDETLPGVNVLVKGTTIGTVTDINGNYRLTTPDDAQTLVFSSVGYTSEEIAINGRTVINLEMAPDIQSLSEVVVIGYGTVKKSDLTGSVSSIDSKEFNPGVNASVDQLIQGRAAGVQITQTSAEPGGGVSVRIRGSSSINAGNQPLYVIDGLPINNGNVTPGAGIVPSSNARNPLNSINPGDIQSIEVLKDASATAIYGSRGANGVILVTTKKGSKNALNVNYNVYGGVQQVIDNYEVLSAQQYVNVLNDLRSAEGEDPEFDAAEIAAIGSGTNWQDEIFRSAAISNHQLSFSGGGESNTYYASLNYFDQDGVVANSGLQRYAAKLNLTQNYGKLTFGINLNTSYQEDKLTPFSARGQNQDAGVIQTAIYYDPTAPVFATNGTYFQSNFINLENPVALTKTTTNVAETNRTFGTAYLEYEIIDGLKAKVNLGSDRQTARRDSYNPTTTVKGAGAGGIADVVTNEALNYLVEGTLNYSKQINENQRIDLLGGATYQNFVFRNANSSALGFPTDAFLTNNLGAGNIESYQIGSNKNRNQLLSYLGRVNYSLFDKYLITASIRADGSSRFGRDNKFGYFPSGAFGWKLGNEPFIEDLDLFSDLKLRASYGITGNQEIGNYRSLTLLGVAGQAVIDGQYVVGIAPNQIPNPDLRWERTGQFNVGLDMGFVEGRVSASLDYYIKNTTDLLLNLPVPITSGFQTSLQNVGSVRNQGFELLVNTKNLVGDFTWESSLNFSAIRNEVTDLADVPFILQGGFGFLPDFAIIREGEPINAYYGYKVAGVFQTSDDIDNSAQPLAQPGELKYEDVDGDGEITPEDRTILGSPIPDFTYGFSNTFGYKGITLSVFIQGSYGNELFNRNLLESDNPTSFRRNRFADSYLNRWTPSNPTNENPSFIDPSTAYGGNNNSRYVEDASFLRIRNINLGYDIPVAGVSFLKSANVYFSVQNVFTITNYSGNNPETSSYGDSGIVLDFNAYPLPRIYTIGANIGF